MKKSLSFIILLFIVVGSCQRKDLLEPHTHYNTLIEVHLISNVELNKPPQTVTYHIYEKNGTYKTSGKINGSTDWMSLPTGIYDMLLYTSDFYDIDAVLYKGLNQKHTAEAYTRKSSRTMQAHNMIEPDPVFSVVMHDIVIQDTEEMQTITANLHQRSYLYYLYIEVEGLKYVNSINMKIDGMHTSAFLADGSHRENEYGAQSLEMKMMGDEKMIYGEFWAFGPHQNNDVKNTITLNFVNGKSTTIELEDISEKIKLLTEGGEIIVDQKFEIKGQEGGFNPGVGDWDDYEVDIIF